MVSCVFMLLRHQIYCLTDFIMRPCENPAWLQEKLFPGHPSCLTLLCSHYHWGFWTANEDPHLGESGWWTGVTMGLFSWEFFSFPCVSSRGPCDRLSFRSCRSVQPLTLLEGSQVPQRPVRPIQMSVCVNVWHSRGMMIPWQAFFSLWLHKTDTPTIQKICLSMRLNNPVTSTAMTPQITRIISIQKKPARQILLSLFNYLTIYELHT